MPYGVSVVGCCNLIRGFCKASVGQAMLHVVVVVVILYSNAASTFSYMQAFQ